MWKIVKSFSINEYSKNMLEMIYSLKQYKERIIKIFNKNYQLI